MTTFTFTSTTGKRTMRFEVLRNGSEVVDQFENEHMARICMNVSKGMRSERGNTFTVQPTKKGGK
jgi:hypothetical protein